MEDGESPFTNILSGLYLRDVKNKGTDEGKFKARFDVQGHRDHGKRTFVHVSATVEHKFLRILVSVTATFDLEIWSRDVTQACVQGKVLSRLGYMKPDSSFGLSKGRILRIIRTLYDISHVGDARRSTINEFLTSSL